MKFSIAVFSSRESLSQIERLLESIEKNRVQQLTHVSVFINGNLALAESLASVIKRKNTLYTFPLFIHHCALGDKANAWNQCLYQVLKNEEDYLLCLDGYVCINAATLTSFVKNTFDNHYLAITGVPKDGPSAEAQKRNILDNGGIHGNCFALSRDCINLIKQANFKLPIGIYRTDSLIRAAVCFNFDPSVNDWDDFGVKGFEEMTWNVEQRYDLNRILSYIKRMLRQKRGSLENQAIKALFVEQKIPLKKLPISVHRLLLEFSRRPDIKKRVSPLERRYLSKFIEQTKSISIKGEQPFELVLFQASKS